MVEPRRADIVDAPARALTGRGPFDGIGRKPGKRLQEAAHADATVTGHPRQTLRLIDYLAFGHRSFEGENFLIGGRDVAHADKGAGKALMDRGNLRSGDICRPLHESAVCRNRLCHRSGSVMAGHRIARCSDGGAPEEPLEWCA